MRPVLWLIGCLAFLVAPIPGWPVEDGYGSDGTAAQFFEWTRGVATREINDFDDHVNASALAQVVPAIQLTRDPALLHRLTLKLHTQALVEFRRCDGYCPKAAFYMAAIEAAIARLSEMATSESAEVLISLLNDDERNWGAHTYEELAIAIVNSGPAALPHLRERDAGASAALIAAIERGERWDH